MEIRPSIDYPILRRPQVSMGIGFQSATLIWSGGVLGFMMIDWPLAIFPIILSGLIHVVASWFFKLDHRIFEIYTHYSQTPNIFRAGQQSHGEMLHSRPKGYGRGVNL